MENSMAVPQETRKRSTIWPSNTIPGYKSEKDENIHVPPVYIAFLTCKFGSAQFNAGQLVLLLRDLNSF